MVSSRILVALTLAAVCSSALGAGIYRAESKGSSYGHSDSSFASPALVGARKSAELSRSEASKAPQKPLERLEQIKQEPATQLKEEYTEQAPIKQEEYREEPAPPTKLAQPKTERKAPATSAIKLQPAPIKFEEQLREEQKEYKQERIETYEQKRQQELDSERPAYASTRYEEQQQAQLDEQAREPAYAEPKGSARKPPSFAGLEQVKQQREEELPQQPAGEPEPYQFSYEVDGSSRTEQQDTKGVVRGQYTLQGADGASRVVDYVADHNGFRASVSTNEFGTESKSPANIQLRTSQPLAEEIAIRVDAGKTSLKRTEATKGGQKTSREEPLYAAKGYAQAQEQLKESPSWPAKGQSAELRPVEPQQEQLRVPSEELQLDQPQLPRFGSKYAQTRSSFESATAHQERRVPVAPVASRSRTGNVRPLVL